ncbi:hypothetical protein [Thalassotalea mangrovi]|uniref:Tetratricopeptide repeat protein n=1 Tax=Thalassotalea mangrovi TaxID=2572245 RepID=A0A4U1B420_9GAMM|nr:hypothetical protein [Thalassotalea mangrovi]TKB44870.1 hypothetical protein E8M12_10205 [Thalassotalea mangrovi]
MAKSIKLIGIFVLTQLLFACASTESPQHYKAELKERVSWQPISKVSAKDVVDVDFRDGRLVDNRWIIDLSYSVQIKEQKFQQRIEYYGTDKPFTLDSVLAETKCAVRAVNCDQQSIDWKAVEGEETFVGFTEKTRKQTMPYREDFGQISTKLQVRQGQKITSVPVTWQVKNQKLYIELQDALLNAPFQPEKAILLVEYHNPDYQETHKVVFGDYIFGLLGLSASHWHHEESKVQEWLDRLATCLPAGDIPCALEQMQSIEQSGESLPDSFYYHMASMYLMAGDQTNARVYAKKYLGGKNHSQYLHQARAML